MIPMTPNERWDEFIGDFITHRYAGHENYRHLELDEWTDDNIHISDVGYCPRAVILRIGGYDRRPKTALQMRRFYMGHVMHNVVYNAFLHSDLELYSAIEFSVTDYLKAQGLDHVTGTCDLIAKMDYFTFGPEHARDLSVNDIKSQHPNMLRDYRYTLPKKENVYQVVLYQWALKDAFDLCGNPFVTYMDNGGGDNESELCEIFDWDNKPLKEARYELGYLIGARSAYIKYNIVPPILPKVLKVTGRSNPSIQIQPSWNCNPKYCDFMGISCIPPEGKNRVGYLDEMGKYKTSKAGYAEVKKYGLEGELDKLMSEEPFCR